MKKVVFVCTGNTCRSPMAEAIFKHILKQKGINDIKVSSCGIAAQPGEPMADNAKKALKSMGIPPTRHKSALCGSQLDKANIIVTMTEGHKRYFGDKKNVYTLGSFIKTGDINDPYGQSQEVYMLCAAQILNACHALLDILK